MELLLAMGLPQFFELIGGVAPANFRDVQTAVEEVGLLHFFGMEHGILTAHRESIRKAIYRDIRTFGAERSRTEFVHQLSCSLASDLPEVLEMRIHIEELAQ